MPSLHGARIHVIPGTHLASYCSIDVKLPHSHNREMSPVFRLPVLLFLLGLMLAPSLHAEGLPGPVTDGEYTLMKISGGSLIGLGSLHIRGNTYRVGDEGSFKPFTIDAKGLIVWSAGLACLPDDWKVVKTIHSKDNSGRPLLKIHYLSARGTADLIDALKEK